MAGKVVTHRQQARGGTNASPSPSSNSPGISDSIHTTKAQQKNKKKNATKAGDKRKPTANRGRQLSSQPPTQQLKIRSASVDSAGSAGSQRTAKSAASTKSNKSTASTLSTTSSGSLPLQRRPRPKAKQGNTNNSRRASPHRMKERRTTSRRKPPVHPHAQGKKNIRRRRVLFDEDVVVYEVPRLSAKRATAVWWTPREFSDMRLEIQDTAELLAMGMLTSDDEDYCARGVETEKDTQERNRNRLDAVHSVLNEQDRQREENTFDDGLLASVYTAASSHCTEQALLLAENDSKDSMLNQMPPAKKYRLLKKGSQAARLRQASRSVYRSLVALSLGSTLSSAGNVRSNDGFNGSNPTVPSASGDEGEEFDI